MEPDISDVRHQNSEPEHLYALWLALRDRRCLTPRVRTEDNTSRPSSWTPRGLPCQTRHCTCKFALIPAACYTLLFYEHNLGRMGCVTLCPLMTHSGVAHCTHAGKRSASGAFSQVNWARTACQSVLPSVGTAMRAGCTL